MLQASCASCGTETPSLSRCSRCHWVSYCTKDCQRRHWTRGDHRTLCATLRRVAAFRDNEKTFWATRSPTELTQFADQYGGLDPTSMCFYGEVLFVLKGLKPSMLFSNLPSSWRKPFLNDVVVASGVLDSSTECTPALRVVSANVQTPAEYALRDTLVLVNTSHPVCTIVDQTLHLLPVLLPLARELQDGGGQVYLVNETELARLLDYPIALDECEDAMIEVGYFAVASDGTRELLLSYCASAIASHATRIHTHFCRYQEAFDAATLTLTLETTPL